MYCVEVYTELFEGQRLTRFLVFETYTTAANCIMTLNAREPGPHCPEDFFEAGDLYREKRGEQLGEPIQTDFVFTYLGKTKR